MATPSGMALATARPDEARQLPAAARRDCLAFGILAGSESAPVEIALFPAQQSIEKALKAMLATHDVAYWRTHDLLLSSRWRQT